MFLRLQDTDQTIFDTSLPVLNSEDNSAFLSHNSSFQGSPFKEKSFTLSTTSIEQDGGISFTVPSKETKSIFGMFCN